MGGKTTKLFKSSNQSNSKPHDNSPKHCNDEQFNHNVNHKLEKVVVVNNSISPFVHYRKGSMYIDEDGDVAHEFYIETKEGSKVTMKKISNQYLTPQGNIPLDVPCIRNDYPVILLDHNREKE